MSNLSLFIAVATAIVFILIITQIFGRLITLIGQPKVVGEMISGVLLGPTCFGYFLPEASSYIFNPAVMPYLYVIGNLGLSIYMFLIGNELDTNVFSKKLIKQSSIISLSTILLPLILGAVVSGYYFDIFSGGKVSSKFFSIFVGTALAITAFPMMARILEDRGLLKTKIGSLIMISASIQDVISWVLLAFVTSIAKQEGYLHGYITLGGAFIFILLIFLIVKPLLKKVGKQTEINNVLSQNHFSIIVIILLASALITDKIGLYSVFGGFILGLAMPKNPIFQNEIIAKLKPFTLAVFLPLFFTFSGLNANMLILSKMTYFLPCVVIVSLAFASKYFSSLFSMKFCGYSWRESSAVGGLINARGLMELIVTNIGLMYGIINKEFYSILILVAILTTLSATPIFNLSIKKNSKLE